MTTIEHLLASARVAASIAADKGLAAAVHEVASAASRSYRQGGKILLAGNGGSAADCLHIAGELVGRYRFDRPGLAAIALPTDASVNTAIANDYGYQQAFARQVQALGRAGDLLWAYSTSGNSANIIAAIETAREQGITVVGFTGGSGGRIRDLCHHLLLVPSDQTPLIQQGHLSLGHAICELIENQMFGEAG
ncbi:MAG: D-sedoheptulose 7-phosphate isomerase [Burkholderiaceae bacterium]